jgi:primosomal protein N' (replication factor Y)
MKLYRVIPIAKGISKETLSYFGSDTIPLGALVTIPLRKKNAHALVIESRDVDEAKADIKTSAYSLKKIGAVKNPAFLSSLFLEAAAVTAEEYGTTTGSILQSLVPKIVLEHGSAITQGERKKEILKKEILVIQETDEERFAHYKSFIRGEFARGSSVFFCLPTAEDIRRTKALLEKGIEQYTCILHAGLSKKEFLEALNVVNTKNHPVLVIGTPAFLSVLPKNLGSIVLDRENSRSYRTQGRPYFDLRVFVKILAKKLGIKLLLGDLLLSVETLWRQKNDEYAEFFPLKFRMLSSAESLILDMKLKRGTFEKEFRVISRELEALIDKTKEENENLFIFCARKGLSPLTVCGDCGQAVTCKRCSAPVTLYSRKEENKFVCNKCGEERGAAERCSNCESWKLETLGIGVELVEKEILQRFPETKIFRLDKESVSTEKRALDMIAKFESTPGAILIGTEMALLYLSKPLENVAVASIDALFSLPDFRIREKIMYLLLSMRARAEKVFLIQTRNGEEKLFDYALKGNLIDFYREEIDERETFKYPPFSVFVKMTVEGKRAHVEKEMEGLLEYFKEWHPAPFESRHLSLRGNHVLHVLFRFNPDEWPLAEFLAKVRTLPPHIVVRIDPESLLS